jgi:carboxypeptidase Q
MGAEGARAQRIREYNSVHRSITSVRKIQMSRLQLLSIVGVLAACFAGRAAAGAQISAPAPDPLARMRQLAAENTQACSEDEISACAQAAPKIIANAMGASPMAENLRHLTDEIGGRLTGSPQIAKAAEWAVQAFRDAGIDDVHTEKFMIPHTWSEGATRVEIVSGAAFPVHAVSVAWSPATPPNGIQAELVDAGTGSPEDFARLASGARGAILLVHTDVLRTFDDLFAEYLRNPGIIERATAAGANAILWMGTREQMLLYRHLTGLGQDGSMEKLPQAIVAREDAERLARGLAAGQHIQVRLELPNRVGGPAEAENVVAEIRGRERPEEFVLLGAHLDSFELGTGALDDGCNAALVIEAARDIHLTGLRPKRSIRFVLFSGEEEGMLGSWAYVRAHREELGRADAAIIFDEGSGRVTGFSLGGRRDLQNEVLKQALAPLDSWGVRHFTSDAILGTDNLDFLLEGVPNLVANQEEANYVANYHASSDTYDKVDILNLKFNTAVAGVLTFSLAEFATPLGPRLTRSQVADLLKQSGLELQLKTLEVWTYWENGQRGRQP